MIINNSFQSIGVHNNYFVSADWLLDRRHCNLKWQNAVKDIREKINVAIQDMPENEEIKQLLSGSCKIFTIPYFCNFYCNTVLSLQRLIFRKLIKTYCLLYLIVTLDFIFKANPTMSNCFQRCFLNCFSFVNRHSLLPLLEDSRDSQKD